MTKKLKFCTIENGFTLVEVLVAVLLTTLFVATAMQAVAISALMKLRAREYSEAITWIQEDVETVKSISSNLAEDATKCQTQNPSASGGYAALLQTKLPRDTTKNITVNSQVYTAVNNPGFRQIAGSTLWLMRSEVIDDNPSVDGSIKYDPAFMSLSLNYLVVPNKGNAPTTPTDKNYRVVAALETEVIPNAAFKCP